LLQPIARCLLSSLFKSIFDAAAITEQAIDQAVQLIESACDAPAFWQ
jgi:hypothetical protein